MKSYIDRNMKECKSVATPKSRDSGRWWMFAVFMILDMKDTGGLLKRKWWEALTVECGWTVLCLHLNGIPASLLLLYAT